jgi:hypothetical protein
MAGMNQEEKEAQIGHHHLRLLEEVDDDPAD